MPVLDITPEQLTEACRSIYAASGYQHAPAQLFIEHYNGDTTFLRASFPEKFTHAAACKLDQLRTKLLSIYGAKANLTFVIYYDRLDPMTMAAHAADIAAL